MGSECARRLAGRLVSAAGLLALAGLAPAQPGEYRVVAMQGEPAVGAGTGVVFGSADFASAAINDAGQVAFKAGLAGPGVDSGNDVGVWLKGAGTLEMVARKGEPAPGCGPGVVFESLGGPRLNEAGIVGLSAILSGPAVDETNDVALFAYRGGTLELVAREGDPAAGIADATYAQVRFGGLDSAGRIVFGAPLAGPGVTADNDTGLWIGAPGDVVLLAREGDTAPTEPPTIFGPLPVGEIATNDAGHVAFVSGNAIWSNRGGTLEPVITAPQALSDGTSLVGLPGTPLLNDAGGLAFRANVVPAGSVFSVNGLCAEDGASSFLVAAYRHQAPGFADGVEFGQFFGPVLCSEPGTTFVNNTSGPGLPAGGLWGVWAQRDGVLAPVALDGDPAPGTAAAFEDMNSAVLWSNEAGQVAFAASAGGGSFAESIWMTDDAGVLRPLLPHLALVDVDDDPAIEELHRFHAFPLQPHLPTDGELNNAGELVLVGHSEEDGRRLLIVAKLGEPCACELDGDAAQVDVFDLLAYLDAWFAGDAAAELTGDDPAAVDVFDLLTYLDCWFPASAGGGC